MIMRLSCPHDLVIVFGNQPYALPTVLRRNAVFSTSKPHPNVGNMELASPRAAPHPIDRNAQFAVSTREAAGYFVRRRMLAQSVLTAQTFFSHYLIIIVGYGALPHVHLPPLTFCPGGYRENSIPQKETGVYLFPVSVLV